MATESVILTALPNGLHESGDFLQVTAFVSPRLSTDGDPSLPLRDFPAFRNWPAALGDARLSVEIDGVGVLDTEPDPASQAADPGLWTLVFDEDDVGVVTGAFRDLSDRTFRSFPANDVAGAVLDLYGQVASLSATDYPPVTQGPVGDLARQLGLLGIHKHRYYGIIDDLIADEHGADEKKRGRYLPRGAVPAGQRAFLAFAQAYRFYDRDTRDPAGPGAAPPPPDPPKIDFHGYVAFLGDYPRLLRPLGLAVDLLARVPRRLEPEGKVRIAVDGGAMLAFAAEERARPWTSYQRADRRFLALPRRKEGDLVDGMLRLESPRLFGVHQIDVDGSALKTVDYAGNALRMAAHLEQQSRSMSPDAASLPALRTGGFVVVRDDRAAATVDQLDAAAGHEADVALGTATELFAEDVTRGARVDVLDEGSWRSLCARRGTYVVTRGGLETPIPIPDDEGFVKGSSTTSTATPSDTDLYLHEAVFGWDGWSLVAKRPGRPIVETLAESPVGDPQPRPPEDFPLVTGFAAVPGTLPRLRFGRTYRFRARAVDMAGNSVREDDIVATHVSPHPNLGPHRFLRFDPVPSPAVVPRRRFTEGESLLRMVIRSTLGVVPADYVALPRIAALGGHTDPATAYLEVNDRHLAPPKTSVQLAEWHAMFDAAMGPGAGQGQRDAQFTTASREDGSYIDDGAGAFVVNPDPAATPTDLATHRKGDPLQPGEYVCHDVDELDLPYLPDPASAGISFSILAGDAATRTLAWLGGDWPDRRPVRVRMEHGGLTTDPAPPPAWDPDARRLTVFLRQAELVTVRVSSVAADLDVLGVWALEPPAVQAVQLADATAGRHWMLTPFAELTFVHAVEQPLTAPVVAVDDAGVRRNLGETFAVLDGEVTNHAKSTGRLDLEAAWDEPLDDVARDVPTVVQGAAHVADFLLEADEDACRVGRDDAPRAGLVPAVHKVRHEFRDTKHRDVRYRAIATTRFREYFPSEITDDPSLVTHAGPETLLDVPSSKRPDPPEVLYVVPTFSWQDETFRAILPDLLRTDMTPALARAVDALPAAVRRAVGRRAVRGDELPGGFRLPVVHRRTRRAGLRVYLARPWYSSGDGELLAAVVPDQPYIVWPRDLDRGLVVDARARMEADEAAERLLAADAGGGAGRSRQPASERLLRGLGRSATRTPEAVEAAAGLTAVTSEALTGLLGRLTVASGDPEKYVTRFGSDPIWGSNPPDSGPWIHQFPLRHRVGTGLALAEAPGHTVAAVGHLPKYDPDRRLWYCDVDVDAGASYFPFVRLGVARFQPSSIPGVHLSRVVFPEWAQLAAERTATVSRSGNRVRVTVRGPGGYTDAAEGLLGPLAARGPDGMALSRFAVAQVERRPADATTDLAWAPVGDEVRLDVDLPAAYADVRFTGGLTVPAKKAGEQLRLSVREYEILGTDASQADDHIVRQRVTDIDVSTGGTGGVPNVTPVLTTIDQPVRCRLVYADYLDL